MLVRAKEDKNKVLKGVQYETDYINYDSMSVKTVDSGVHLGWYKKEDFTLSNGSEITITNYNQRNNQIITVDDLSVGDIIVCKTNRNYKFFVKGGKYRISEVASKQKFKIKVIVIGSGVSKT